MSLSDLAPLFDIWLKISRMREQANLGDSRASFTDDFVRQLVTNLQRDCDETLKELGRRALEKPPVEYTVRGITINFKTGYIYRGGVRYSKRLSPKRRKFLELLARTPGRSRTYEDIVKAYGGNWEFGDVASLANVMANAIRNTLPDLTILQHDPDLPGYYLVTS